MVKVYRRFIPVIILAMVIVTVLAYAVWADVLQVKMTAAGETTINWTNGTVVTTGFGASMKKPGRPIAVLKPLARRAAIVDAQRNLLEMIKGVYVKSDTMMRDFMIEHDIVETKVSGIIKGATLIPGSEKFTEEKDGSIGCKLQMKISFGEVASVVYEEVKEEFVAVVTKVPVVEYTGLIVDARGFNYNPSVIFRIYDEDMNIVYGISTVDFDTCARERLGLYVDSLTLSKTIIEARVGTNPLWVKAVKMAEPNHIDFIISHEDAQKVLAISKGPLYRCKVVLLVDRR
ncbi:MAG: hypothetical protein J7M18_06835 [Candidatus Eremiobacteraeota bacterium]|nr:hypothetical protein [Candidatus Eremiobacteraeota bacterium]